MSIKLNYIIIGLCVSGIVSTFSACKKSANTSPTDTQLAFTLNASGNVTPVTAAVSNGAQTTNATGSASINWTAGTANVSAFKLETKKRGVEVEISSKNLTSIDLFAATPASISATIDTGTYREIELRVLFAKTTTAAIPLTLKGNYTSTTGTVTPIEFDFNDEAVIKVEAENVTIDGSTDFAALAKLDVSKLIGAGLAGALDAATRTNGTIVISSSSNINIYNAIKARITECGKWGGFERHDKSGRR